MPAETKENEIDILPRLREPPHELAAEHAASLVPRHLLGGKGARQRLMTRGLRRSSSVGAGDAKAGGGAIYRRNGGLWHVPHDPSKSFLKTVCGQPAVGNRLVRLWLLSAPC